MRRLLPLLFLLPFLACASVFCYQPGTLTGGENNGHWVTTTIGSFGGQRGSCGVTATRPIWYLIHNSYGTGTAAFDSATYDKDAQMVFSDANLGDKIFYEADQEYFPGANKVRITRRPGTGTLEVTTTEFAKLPPDGTRITPAYKHLMATISSRTGSPTVHGAPAWRLIGANGGSADHIKFRGLWLQYAADPTIEGNSRIIDIGNAGRSSADAGAYTSIITQTPHVGDTDISVLDTAGFALTTPRQRVMFANDVVTGGPTAQMYTVEGVNSGAGTVTITQEGMPPGNGLTDASISYRLIHLLNRDGDSIYEPDDITIQHCVFTSPQPGIQSGANYIVFNSRKATFRDNWTALFDTLSITDEPHTMTSSNSYGPHIFENNYMFGGITMFYGGAYSSTNAHLDGGGTWRFNHFNLPNEYNLVGEWAIIFGGQIPGMEADMSLPGLPPNSPRFVHVGRSLVLETSNQYWTARNSGVVGTTRPSCITTTAVYGWASGKFCYDGDPSRVGYGQTYCPPQGNATGATPVLNDGDGVCWQRDQAQHAVKNAWETKNSRYQTIQYNVFNSFPPVAGYNTTQVMANNFKIDNSYQGQQFDYPDSTGFDMHGAFGTGVGKTTGKVYTPGDTTNPPGCRYYIASGTTTAVYLPSNTAAPPADPTTIVEYFGVVVDAAKAAKWAANGGYNGFPECGRSAGDHFTIKNNWYRNVWGGAQYTGDYNTAGKGFSNGDFEFSNNFIQMRGFTPTSYAVVSSKAAYNATAFSYRCFFIGKNSGERGDPNNWPIVNITWSNNTCYTPYPQADIGNQSSPWAYQSGLGVVLDDTWDVYGGRKDMSGNIIGRGANGIFYGANRLHGEGESVAQFWPGTARTVFGDVGTFTKNAFLGSAGNAPDAATPYPGGSGTVGVNYQGLTLGYYPGNHTCATTHDCMTTATVWTGCDATVPFDPTSDANFTGTTPCAGGNPSAPAAPDFTKVMINPAGGDFRTRNDFKWGKRSMSNGTDIGADPTQLPMIQQLTVTPTDRAAVFQYRLTAPIANIPCVIELHTAPDLMSTSYAGNATGYASELAQLLPATALATIQDSAGNNIDSDAHDRNYRDTNRRMILAPTLVNNTVYYYRLHCGGDALVGMFTTSPTMSSTNTQTIARTVNATGVASMKVEYGTSYSRATDTITGSTASTNCTAGNRCVVTFSATRGTMIYYRWKEMSAVAGGGSVLKTGKVEVFPAL